MFKNNFIFVCLTALSLMVTSNAEAKRFEELQCESEGTGKFTLKYDSREFWVLTFFNNDGSVKETHSNNRPNFEDPYYRYFYVGSYGGTYSDPFGFNFHVDSGGVVDWTEDDNNNRCLVAKPLDSLLGHGELSSGNGTVTVYQDLSINPRAKIYYYPIVLDKPSIHHITLDGKLCPDHRNQNPREYSLQCQVVE